MSTNSKIEWTQHTWNPVTGCTKVSQGCKYCYAEVMYERFNGSGSFKNIICHDDRLLIPLKWKKPVIVFVNSMSDLFHEKVPFEFIRKVFGVMAVCQDHTFQILTKRAKRMIEFFEWMKLTDPDFQNDPANDIYDLCIENGIETGCGSAFITDDWPLKNVWMGVSVEDQKAADERIPILMETPAAVRFLSCEPLLGPVIIDNFHYRYGSIGRFCKSCTGTGYYNDNLKTPCPDCNHTGKTPWGIDWVICGGESGTRPRTMHPDWARHLRDNCIEEKIPFFFKQWGNLLPLCQAESAMPNLIKASAIRKFQSPNNPDKMNSYYKVPKHIAGRLLDGKEYNEMPVLK